MFWSRKTHFQFLDPIRPAPTAQKDFSNDENSLKTGIDVQTSNLAFFHEN